MTETNLGGVLVLLSNNILLGKGIMMTLWKKKINKRQKWQENAYFEEEMK